MCTMSSSDRTYPLHKPKNHRLPVPRYTLELGDDIEAVYMLYIGIQQLTDQQSACQAVEQAIAAIQSVLKSDAGPSASEVFEHIDGQDAPNTTSWVCYWTSHTKYEQVLEQLNLQTIFSSLPTDSRSSVGLWIETFSTARSRVETNYSGLDYLPGLARLPNSATKEHDLATYWGAARDRIPDSAHDLFPAPPSEVNQSQPVLEGHGQRITGSNHENMVHIRSGQFWENCNDEEAQAYEEKLEPTLQAGLKWLREYPEESGAMAVRYLRNIDSPSYLLEEGREDVKKKKETCGAAFFRNLEDLERWAKGHKSHLAIYGGALKHYKAFPENRMMRTWHEVCVLQAGDANFEYLNCVKGTGAMDGLVAPGVESI